MFKNLDKFDIRDATSWVYVPELGAQARIQVRHAGESNPKYYNAMVKLSGRRVKQMLRKDEVSAEDAAANRRDDRKLFPKHIIVNWEHLEADVPDDAPESEKYVPFSKENAVKLCEVLPNHIFDTVRNHAATPERFYRDEDDDDAPPNPDDLVGNSPGG